MTLAGGPADKAGNRYELKWTASNLARVLLGDASRIRIEPPRLDSAEFWIEADNSREYHQVKRQQTNAAGWTLSSLKTEGVLSGFLQNLTDPNASCRFVSTNGAADLQKLSERARSAASTPEFLQLFAQDTSSKNGIDVLTTEWTCSREHAHNMLRRIHVVTEDEASLDEKLRLQLRIATEGNIEAAVARLMHLALERIHALLEASDIWEDLNAAGVTPTSALHRSSQAIIQTITDDYLANLSYAPILGKDLERSEASQITQLIREGSRLILAHGVAGTGKTGVLRQFIKAERTTGSLVLAARLDRIEPATTAEGLGTSLGLGVSPIVALGRAAHSAKRNVIVLDQVDSACMAAGRHPAFLDGVAALIREATLRDDIFIILACRTYDLDGDQRLRTLISRHSGKLVSVHPLERSTVVDVLASLGSDGRNLTDSQFRLLANPLHLFLFSELQTGKDRSDITQFRSVTDILARYWVRKPVLIRERHSRTPSWGPLFARLCAAMDRRGVLSVPDSILDGFPPEDVEILCSEHVLSRNRNTIAFFHESFFDYAFARTFISEGHDVVGTFTEGDQGLLRRAQLRRILTLMAPDNRDEFRRTTAGLLNASNIRFHLVVAVLDAFRDLTDPQCEDWSILDAWGGSNAAMQPHVDATIFGVDRWLELLSSMHVLDGWLREPEREEFAVRLLIAAYKSCPDIVVSHLSKWIDDGASSPALIGYAFSMCSPRNATQKTASFFERLVEQSLIPAEIPNILGGQVEFWHALRMSQHDDNALTLRLAIKHLQNQCADDDGEGWKNCLKTSSEDAKYLVTSCAHAAPAAYLEAFGPLFLSLLEFSPDRARAGSQFKNDEVWSYRSLGPHYELRSVLLSLLVDALHALGERDPTAARWLEKFALSEFSSAHFVVFAAASRGVTTDPESLRLLFLRRAVSNELGIGYHDADHQLAKSVFRLLADRCAQHAFLETERAVLNYYPYFERTRHALGSLLHGRPSHRGYAQWQLLRGVLDTQLSRLGRRRKQELERKFGSLNEPFAAVMKADFVRSPVPTAAIANMSDSAWLSAIAKYDDKHRSRRMGLIGGVHELAGELQNATRRDPGRFAALALQFPADTAPSYTSAVLRGVDASNLPISVLLPLVTAAQSRPDGACGRAIAWLMYKTPDLEWPESSLAALAHQAVAGHTPVDESWAVIASGGSWEDQNLLQLGLNCDRGAALASIAALESIS